MKNEYEKNKKYLKCIDHTKFILSGSFTSEIVNRMKFSMKIKPEHCRNYTGDLFCLGNKTFEESMN